MPPKHKGKSKGNNRKRYSTHVVDAATEAGLNPMPVSSNASSSQGSSASSQGSAVSPAMGSAPPPTYMGPPVHPVYYGTIPPFGTSYHIPPQNISFPQQQLIPPLQNIPFPQQQQIPPQQNPLFPQQQQIPPQPQQQNPPQPQQQQNPQQLQQDNVVEEDGGGEVVDDVFPDYPRDSRGRFILKPSGNS
jgi:hypothetical protein